MIDPHHTTVGADSYFTEISCILTFLMSFKNTVFLGPLPTYTAQLTGRDSIHLKSY